MDKSQTGGGEVSAAKAQLSLGKIQDTMKLLLQERETMKEEAMQADERHQNDMRLLGEEMRTMMTMLVELKTGGAANDSTANPNDPGESSMDPHINIRIGRGSHEDPDDLDLNDPDVEIGSHQFHYQDAEERARLRRLRKGKGVWRGAKSEERTTAPPANDPSDPSDSDDGHNNPPEVKVKRASGEDCVLRWKKFDFTLDKENHLKGKDNWLVYHDALMLALEEIGLSDNLILTDLDELRVAKAITKTCKRQPLDLVTGIRNGSKMIGIFQKTFSASGKIYQRELWKELSSMKYDGKDPLTYTSKWQLLVRQCKDAGMVVDNQQQATMFFTACEDKAAEWVRFTSKLIKATDMSIDNIIDDFINEFQDKVGKNTNRNTNNHNANANANSNSQGRWRGGRGRGRGGRGGRGGRPSDHKPKWDRELGPLCFNCNEYGHLAKDCPKPKKDRNSSNSQGQSNAASPDKKSGHTFEPMTVTFSARADNCKLTQLIQAYEDEMEKRRTGSSSRDDDDHVMASTDTEPTGTCLVTQAHSSALGKKNNLLFDTGSNVHITNSMDDFDPATIVDIKKHNFKITTGGGTVKADLMGKATFNLVKGGDQYTAVALNHVLYVDTFPIRIISGELFCRYGGKIDNTALREPGGHVIATLDIQKRGFLLWIHGEAEPSVQEPWTPKNQ
ncbi:hypothetical protein F4781DRAFT_436227 [Annulohypoxylon bovei var. microspora]|nr:hypothetical protein F4781DRAFT_436227 [Annulohypoxylon bovei var. microspora]